MNISGTIGHHQLSGGETGEEALLRLILPPWLVSCIHKILLSFFAVEYCIALCRNLPNIRLLKNGWCIGIDMDNGHILCSALPNSISYVPSWLTRCLTTAIAVALHFILLHCISFYFIALHCIAIHERVDFKSGVWQQQWQLHNQLLPHWPASVLHWSLCYLAGPFPFCLWPGWTVCKIVMVMMRMILQGVNFQDIVSINFSLSIDPKDKVIPRMSRLLNFKVFLSRWALV